MDKTPPSHYVPVMRLYLSSFRLGSYSDRLLALLGNSRRTAVVCNAMDRAPDDIRAAGVDREIRELQAIGLDCQELDLRQSGAAEQLAGVDLIWVRGGNTFVLRRVLADSGVDSVLVELLHRDHVAYGGYSAGVCVLTPDLTDLEMVDDLTVVDRPILQGLGILDRSFVPHIRSPDHPESERCDGLAEAYRVAARPHWALRDGQVLIVENGVPELLT